MGLGLPVGPVDAREDGPSAPINKTPGPEHRHGPKLPRPNHRAQQDTLNKSRPRPASHSATDAARRSRHAAVSLQISSIFLQQSSTESPPSLRRRRRRRRLLPDCHVREFRIGAAASRSNN